MDVPRDRLVASLSKGPVPMSVSPFRLRAFDDSIPAFRIRHEIDGQCARIALIGEFDLAGVDPFGEALDRACGRQPAALQIDISHLTFCDSSGVGALAAAARRCRDEGISMSVTGARRPVLAVFDVMQAADLFPFERFGGV